MKGKLIKHVICLAAILLAAAACSNRNKESADKCSDPASIEKTEKGKAVSTALKNPDADWCRACVVGPHGFMSCQRVVAESSSESRGALRAKAREKACEDSGFPKDACPDEKVIAISCKGDEPPKDKTAAGKAMLNALKGSGPLILKSDVKKPDTEPPAKTERPAPGAKEETPKSPAPDKATKQIPVV